MSLLDRDPSTVSEPRFRPGDQVRHDVFGSGEVTEVTQVGVRVRFLDDTQRWLDPVRAPITSADGSAEG
ncbi:MAG: hypothetical protein LC772_04535, partial [Chloroflexi bacterium]|nr:hypothetical protein [Chloroflexota bacterium]